MTIEFTKSAWEDFEFWIENDKDIVKKIKDLLRAIKAHPFKGPGKPEALKYGLNGYWSRRINHEHRLVYKVSGKRGINQKCSIIQCRFHYDN